MFYKNNINFGYKLDSPSVHSRYVKNRVKMIAVSGKRITLSKLLYGSFYGCK